ncbi:polysaccharide biosynthesis tyrosine autokinase [Cellulomonas sp. URHD0024]|uniref:polysaccharide biosynthesis tyrosine autokinase n=1 Tax=Cellulomonas sp. URHD0024 TaxID=1302620 RepID=UPI0004150C11|nr:polysaccharide biosynthesis tyrosine autokinase [Cellulomonas sp. URHD0024]
MDLRELLGLIKRRWLPIVLMVALGGAAAIGFTQNQQKLYTAQAILLVQPGSGATTSDLNDGAVFVARVVQTYANLARTPVVLDPVGEKLGLGNGGSLAAHVTASITSGTTFLTVRATWSNPETAAALANGVADQLDVAVSDIAPRQGGNAALVVSTITPATPPSKPSSPDLMANLAVGLLGGLVVGLGYVLLVSALDVRVRTASDVRRITSVPVLGEIAKRGRPSKSTIARTNPWAEDYRRVRTNLRLLDVDERASTIVVTSCTSGEGAVHVAFSLARTAVEGGLRVALVEADLRSPSLARSLGLVGGLGLGDVLTLGAEFGDVLEDVDGVDVLHAGAQVRNPGDLITSVRMTELVQALAERYELVVIATPPLLAVTDGAAVGAAAEGVVLVVGRPKITRDQLGEAVTALKMAGARLLGIVINDASDETPTRLPVRGARSGRSYAAQFEPVPTAAPSPEASSEAPSPEAPSAELAPDASSQESSPEASPHESSTAASSPGSSTELVADSAPEERRADAGSEPEDGAPRLEGQDDALTPWAGASAP